MTWAWGQASLANLSTCHPDIKRVANKALELSPFDLRVIEGHRGKDVQEHMFDSGRSKLRWPDSKHNKTPSLAMDIVPLPLDWNNTLMFHLMAGIVFAAAEIEQVPLRWGGDWDGDWSCKDQSFHDLPHFELLT